MPPTVAPASRRLSWRRPRLHTPNPPLIPTVLATFPSRPPSCPMPSPCSTDITTLYPFSKKCLQYVPCSEKRYFCSSLRQSRRNHLILRAPTPIPPATSSAGICQLELQTCKEYLIRGE